MTPFNSSETKQLAAALSKAQGAFQHAKKDSENPHFKSRYADLASCIDAAKPHLSANGLSVVQAFDYDNGVLLMRTTLFHESGEWIAGNYPVIVKDATNPQQLGSATTYARRYCFCAIVGLAADDDDGNAASQAKTLPKSKPTLSDTAWAEKCPAWKSKIVDDGKTVAELFKALEGYALTKDQIEEIQSWGK
jgi:hypothetical protein